MEEQEVIVEEELKNNLPPKITKEDFAMRAETKQAKTMLWVKSIVFVFISSFLVAFASYCLIAPNEFTIGGVAGIAILLNALTDVPQSAMIFGINLPLVILAFFFVKKKFAILTTLNIGLQSIWLVAMENAFNNWRIVFENNGNRIFAAVATGLCIGLSLALAFKAGGSTGGADIIAVIIQKKVAANSIAWMLFVINCSVIASSVFVFRGDTPAQTLLPIMMSAFEAYVESRLLDSITNGFHSAIEFRIITNKPEEMSQMLMHEISRGVTSLSAKGMYTKEERSMIVCVVSRRQAASVRKLMKQVDPDSFAVMSTVSQVLGLGFYNSDM